VTGICKCGEAALEFQIRVAEKRKAQDTNDRSQPPRGIPLARSSNKTVASKTGKMQIFDQ